MKQNKKTILAFTIIITLLLSNTAIANNEKFLGEYDNMLEGKTIISFALQSNTDKITGKDLKLAYPENKLSIEDDTTLETGHTILIDNKEKTVVIYGDVNPDGKINIMDAVSILNHVKGKVLLDGVSFIAADFNNNGNLSILNAVDILNVVKGKLEYNQIIKEKEKTELKNNLVSQGKQNALQKAKNYLNILAFSYNGLIDQLKFDGYSDEESIYATDNCGANWNAQALKKAESYINIMAFSYTGLIEQLEYDQFTKEQAIYAADNFEIDWNEQSAKKAKSYMDLMAFSRNALIEQLKFDGFTQEQAEYGVTSIGY